MDELIEELLDMDLTKDDEVIFTEEAKELIHIIAVQCRNTEIYKQTETQGKTYGKDLSAEEIYLDLLVKIVNAPTKLHMIASTRLLIPLIDDKLQNLGGKNERK